MDPWHALRSAHRRMDGLRRVRGTDGTRVLQGDAREICRNCDLEGDPGRAVFYADPPYTKDHYSRMYHVLQTLYLYDFPDSVGRGRVRSSRYLSDFSYKSKAASAVSDLVTTVVGRGAHLLLSYPTRGLIDIDAVRAIVSSAGSVVQRTIPFAHSSLGGRHGAASVGVSEALFLVSPNRGHKGNRGPSKQIRAQVPTVV